MNFTGSYQLRILFWNVSLIKLSKYLKSLKYCALLHQHLVNNIVTYKGYGKKMPSPLRCISGVALNLLPSSMHSETDIHCMEFSEVEFNTFMGFDEDGHHQSLKLSIINIRMIY